MPEKKIIKYCFENETEINTITIIINYKITEAQMASQIKDHLLQYKDKTKDDITHYYLFNPIARYFISQKEDLLESITYQMKNCATSAQEAINSLIDIIAKPNDLANMSLSSSTSTTTNIAGGDMLKIMNELTHSLNVGIFAEEFIEYGGIEIIIKIIDLYKEPNKKTKIIECLTKLLQYENALQYVEENYILESFIQLLISVNPNTPPKNTSLLLTTLICIIAYMKEPAIDIFYRVSQHHAQDNNTKIFSELVNFIDDGFKEIKENAFLLINLILTTISNKNKKTAILNELKAAGLKKMLKKNARFSDKFKSELDNYQKITNEIIPGSNIEILNAKKQIEKYEEHCSNLEKKVEYVFQNQKFYEEVVEDFIYFKKLSETCAQQSSYFQPCKNI